MGQPRQQAATQGERYGANADCISVMLNMMNPLEDYSAAGRLLQVDLQARLMYGGSCSPAPMAAVLVLHLDVAERLDPFDHIKPADPGHEPGEFGYDLCRSPVKPC